MHDWLRVYKAANLPEAGMIQALLEDQGIATQMLGAALSGLGGEIAMADAEPEVWVPATEYERARQLIETEGEAR